MTPPAVPGLAVTRDGHVATVVFDRAEKKNAMTHAMMDGLPLVLGALSEDAHVRVVVLRGRGTAFCAGGDLSTAMDSDALEDDELVARMDRRHRASLLLHTMPKPTIAMVNGVAAGAGLALALACDVRLCAKSAKLSSAFAKVGFSGDYGATWTLTRLVGPERARAFCFAGGVADAEEARSLGMVSRVVDDASLEAETYAFARTLAEAPPLALARMKGNLNLAATADLATALHAESVATVALQRTRDTREALRAFFEKRAPSSFTGS